MVLKDCVGFSANLMVPMDRIAAHVPSDVFEVERAQQGFARMLFKVFTCRENVANETVGPEFSWLESSVFVTPRNESWPSALTHRFVLDFRASNESVTAWLTGLGVPVQLAEFGKTTSPVSGGIIREDWTISNPESGFRFTGFLSGVPGTSISGTVIMWFGDGPYSWMHSQEDRAYDSTDHPMVLESEGNSPSHDVYGDSWPTDDNQAQVAYDATWTIHEQKYG